MMEIINWNYSVDSSELPSINIGRLLNLLSFKSLEFITDEYLDIPKEEGSLYGIVDVSMIGSVHYVKHELRETVNIIKEYIRDYVESEESLEDKIYELSLTRIEIKEYFIGNNVYDPVMIDLGSLITVNGRVSKKGNSISSHEYAIDVRWDACDISDLARQHIADHQHLRNAYIGILDNYLAIEIDKLHLQPLMQKREKAKPSYEKEMQLLEVWIGLRETGFLDHLVNGKMHSGHRKAFFELFQLDDRNYNVRNGELKKRKSPVAHLLPVMIKKLETLHKKKKPL